MSPTPEDPTCLADYTDSALLSAYRTVCGQISRARVQSSLDKLTREWLQIRQELRQRGVKLDQSLVL